MRLLRAEFQNFRLLRDLELKFSTDPIRKLTVIRAENETGKTTILTALQWALYGDSVLSSEGSGYRIHPIDWDFTQARRVPIMVTVDFEVSYRRALAGDMKETRRQYRIVRRCASEELDESGGGRSQSTVLLYDLTHRGVTPLGFPEARINDVLPPELREVFFTDGDRALSFIEADVALSTKRERVERAIRSLLSLEVIEKALSHVRNAAAEVNREARRLDTGSELEEIAARLEEIDNEIQQVQEGITDASQQFASFDEQLVEIDRKITDALQRGDKEKLRRDLEAARRECKGLDERIKTAIEDHAQLFRSQSLACDLLAPVIVTAFKQLEDLRDQRKIPNTTIPVLEERLKIRECICGETLKAEDPSGAIRRQHIEHLIESSRKADEVQGIISDLYFGSRSLQTSPDETQSWWIKEYNKVVKNRVGLQDLYDKAGEKLRSIEIQIDGIPDTDIQGLRETQRKCKENRDRFLRKKTESETQRGSLQLEQKELAMTRDRLLRKQKKGKRLLAELEVTQDIKQVLERSYKRITNEELDKVSNLMNDIFLEMIGADPDQGAIIRRAEISKEFDILVYGSNERRLNPDRDLNGASRRALTLAFILALTKVSEVEAPNVIDTPLGMMSGFVKRSVLRKAIQDSSQLVLLLTHSEIQGCKDLIDEAAGVVVTLTNTAHYPKMLINDPGVSERKVLRCGCNHRTECRICARRFDVEFTQEAAS